MKISASSKSGRWAKGTSGNPAGRPSGSRNYATLACEQLLEGEAEQLTRTLVEKAKTGDLYALRLCLERILPARKERCINLESRPVESLQDLPIHFQDIAAAVAEGRITPGEGESLSNILTAHARTMEVVDLDRRVAELEVSRREVTAIKDQLDRFAQTSAPSDFWRRHDKPTE